MTTQPGIRSTLYALVAPRRAVPIALVSTALVVAQANFNATPHRVPLALGLCGAFVLVAPVSWRLLFHEPVTRLHAAALWAIYVAIAIGVVVTPSVVVPAWLDIGPTLLSEHRLVSVALFVAGGWGLGWHIALEDHLSRTARRLEQAQLLALRAQLDPHFLFNTLNAIAEWCVIDSAVAERAIVQLSSVLRTVLVGVRGRAWSLRDELALFGAVCELHRLRDPSLFDHVVDRVGDVDDIAVPPMILLPLADNAIKHGPRAGHRGRILVRVGRDGDRLVVEIINPGGYRGPRPGSEGLPALARRLALSYARGAHLAIAALPEPPPRTRVELVLPIGGVA